MFNKLFVLAAAAFTLAGAASAQAVVLGGGLAKDCFLRVEAQSTRFTDVERTCTRALESETMTRVNRAATYVNRGIIRMRAGRHAAALRDYERAIGLQDELGEAFLNKGAAHILMGDHGAAVVALDRAIDLDTNDLHAAHYNRALAREQSGDVTGAYYDFKTASELRPEWPLPQRQLERFTVTEGS